MISRVNWPRIPEQGDVVECLVELRSPHKSEPNVHRVSRVHLGAGQEDHSSTSGPSRKLQRVGHERGSDALTAGVRSDGEHAQAGIVRSFRLRPPARRTGYVRGCSHHSTPGDRNQDGGVTCASGNVTQPRFIRAELRIDGAVCGDGHFARGGVVGWPRLADGDLHPPSLGAAELLLAERASH